MSFKEGFVLSKLFWTREFLRASHHHSYIHQTTFIVILSFILFWPNNLLLYSTTVLLETWTYREGSLCMMPVGSPEYFPASPTSSENLNYMLKALFLHPSTPVADARAFCSARWDEMIHSAFYFSEQSWQAAPPVWSSFVTTVLLWMPAILWELILLCSIMFSRSVIWADLFRDQLKSDQVLKSDLQLSIPIVYWCSHHDGSSCFVLFYFQMRNRVWGTVCALLCMWVYRLM